MASMLDWPDDDPRWLEADENEPWWVPPKILKKTGKLSVFWQGYDVALAKRKLRKYGIYVEDSKRWRQRRKGWQYGVNFELIDSRTGSVKHTIWKRPDDQVPAAEVGSQKERIQELEEEVKRLKEIIAQVHNVTAQEIVLEDEVEQAEVNEE